jgi:hypothetical protein
VVSAVFLHKGHVGLSSVGGQNSSIINSFQSLERERESLEGDGYSLEETNGSTVGS